MAKRTKRTVAERRPTVETTFGAARLARPGADIALTLAERELAAGNWQHALEWAGQCPSSARIQPIIGFANFRLARRAALKADFTAALEHAERAVAAVPSDRLYQLQRGLVRKAAVRVLRERDMRFFPDTMGPSSGCWWKQDLLATVRGWDGQEAAVEAPLIMREITRAHLEEVYALGIYVPQRAGIPPRYTKYMRELKKHGRTVAQAAMLLWQGLTMDTASSAPEWIERVDLVVPMATGWRSYESRGHELTEILGKELADLLCLPMIDLFERVGEDKATHQLAGVAPRLDALERELTVKKNVDLADLKRAQGALIVDDIVTYGATFEACARRLKQFNPELRCYGAALAYTQTEARLERARRERAA
jgi:predicted amidophosphoribosyltransferase